MSRREIEEKITRFWEKNRVFERSVEERPKEKEYVFYDGPPFATGIPHQGHILGLTSKDVFPRYWTMKGWRVERRWGWDCHGLPIENIAEKELKIKKKNQIEEFGVDKFNEFCRSKVLFFANEWKKTVGTMGKWIEFDNSYKTMDQSYMETVWWLFKKFYEEGYIYEGKKILLYCPRCQTPLANSEIQMDDSYKGITEKAVTVAFKLKGNKDEYLLAWTTTPWTLIGNIAIAVNGKLDYVKAEAGGKKFIVAKSLAGSVLKVLKNYKVIEEVKGAELVGLEYEPLYEMDLEGKRGFLVIDGEEGVTAEDGTGMVHIAAYGEFDFVMIKKYGLAAIQHIGNDGSLAEGPKQWLGKWFKDLDIEVLADLQKKGLLFEAKDYAHTYPFCYRCETPLIYNAVDSWFVDIQKIKPRLLERAKAINWHPGDVKEGRFKHIVETAPDWSISRNRFWATPIPVWKCSCGKMKVIGSIEELKRDAVEQVASGVDLHKHVVDKIHLKCKCGKSMSRIPEVLDCWFESGSMPYAAKHYPFENSGWLKKNYPADFVSEYVAQVRAWFYYMHVIGVLLMDRAPFKNVVVSGNVLAADGSKMSKSKSNYTDPNVLFEKYGADAVRFYLMSSQLMRAQDLNFRDENVGEIHRKIIALLANVKSFYGLFGKENNVLGDKSSENVLDRWLVSETERLVRDSTKNLDAYDTTKACLDLLRYVDGLSTWFVRRSRERFKGESEKEKQEAMRTLAYALDTLAKVIAPLTPFIAEEIYQSLRNTNYEKPVSVHLEKWPSFEAKLIDEGLGKEMESVREIVSKALDERKKAGIAVKQPLKRLTIKGTELGAEYFDLIKGEINVKEIRVEGSAKKGGKKAQEGFALELDAEITKGLLVEGAAREIIRQINDYRKELRLTISQRIELDIEAEGELAKEALDAFRKEIMRAVQADRLELRKCGENAKKLAVQKSEMKAHIRVLK